MSYSAIFLRSLVRASRSWSLGVGARLGTPSLAQPDLAQAHAADSVGTHVTPCVVHVQKIREIPRLVY